MKIFGCFANRSVLHLHNKFSFDNKTGNNDDDYDINDYFWSCCQSLRKDFNDDDNNNEDDDHEHDDKDDGELKI